MTPHAVSKREVIFYKSLNIKIGCKLQIRDFNNAMKLKKQKFIIFARGNYIHVLLSNTCSYMDIARAYFQCVLIVKLFTVDDDGITKSSMIVDGYFNEFWSVCNVLRGSSFDCWKFDERLLDLADGYRLNVADKLE